MSLPGSVFHFGWIPEGCDRKCAGQYGLAALRVSREVQHAIHSVGLDGADPATINLENVA